jgi:hypothetical protein
LCARLKKLKYEQSVERGRYCGRCRRRKVKENGVKMENITSGCKPKPLVLTPTPSEGVRCHPISRNTHAHILVVLSLYYQEKDIVRSIGKKSSENIINSGDHLLNKVMDQDGRR